MNLDGTNDFRRVTELPHRRRHVPGPHPRLFRREARRLDRRGAPGRSRPAPAQGPDHDDHHPMKERQP
ncbi:MAG: hypothetical protein MZV64_49325 [Ignavibacteriales bacterium]|nr:hypothetical protein [Ignavibacteriales bacterium]